MNADRARRDGQSIEVNVSAHTIPRYVDRNANRPSRGEQQLDRFLADLFGQGLVDVRNAGDGLSKDGTRFRFLITPLYPKKEQLEAICAAYRHAIGRQLTFVTDPRYDDVTEVVDFDWGGMLGRVLGTLGRLNPFD